MSIGGYHGLYLPDSGHQLHSGAIALQSARACLYLYLQSSGTSRLYLPEFICGSIFSALEGIGIEYDFYRINSALLPEFDRKLSANEKLLAVNYFGIISNDLDKYLDRFPGGKTILDSCQALFAPVSPRGATVYSPRKFLGIPDGGYLYSDVPIETELEPFAAESHVSHLLLRAAGETQKGYDYFLRAEAALADPRPRAMSAISKRLVRSYDAEHVKKTRRRNYRELYRAFRGENLLDMPLDDGDTPLCYPLMTGSDVSAVCKRMYEAEIYLPRYWPNLFNKALGRTSHRLVNQTLYLPVDHTIDDDKLRHMIACVETAMRVSESDTNS